MWSRDLTFSNRNAFRLHKLPSKHGDSPRPTPVKCYPTKAKFCNETFSNPIPQHCTAPGLKIWMVENRFPERRVWEGFVRLSRWGGAPGVIKVSQVQPVRSRSTAKKWKLTIPTGRPVVLWARVWLRVWLLLTYSDEIGIYSSLCQIKRARCGFELWPPPRSPENW